MINLNSNIYPAKRKDAFLIAEKLLKGDEVTKKEKEQLFKYFMPSIPKVCKNGWQWVAKACGKKDVRYYLNYLYSDGKRLIGCDGHRLHLIETTLKPGFYDPKTLNPVSVDAKYPDIDRLFKKSNQNDFMDLFVCDFKEGIESAGKHKINFFEIGKNETRINKEYLLDALNGENSARINTFDSDKVSIEGFNEFGTFLIMPMRK